MTPQRIAPGTIDIIGVRLYFSLDMTMPHRYGVDAVRKPILQVDGDWGTWFMRYHWVKYNLSYRLAKRTS